MTERLRQLEQAARDGDYEKVMMSLKEPAFDPRHFLAELALVCASASDHPEIVALLLKAGVSPNAEDSKGETAMMAAVTAGHSTVARLLLDAGADPDRSYGGVIGTREALARLLGDF